jgi:FixJ family two-component response regulator
MPVSKTQPLIAVVDDEEPVRIALRRLLRSAGLDVETFPSGAEFLESLKLHQPDCVVLDLHMPRVNGFAVQARRAEAGIGLPVVVITGHDSAETRERGLAGGVSAYLRKPVDDQTLLDAISAAIAHPPETSAPGEKNQPG